MARNARVRYMRIRANIARFRSEARGAAWVADLCKADDAMIAYNLRRVLNIKVHGRHRGGGDNVLHKLR